MNTLAHESAYRGNDVLTKMGTVLIGVCGCGAVGSNLVDNMIRQGFKRLTVIDMDRVEDHNRNTQVWGRRDVGQLKVNAMKNRAFQEMGVTIGTVSSRLDADNVAKILGPVDLVVDGFDNSDSRAVVTSYCRDAGKDCVHVGLAADYAEIIWNEDYTVPKGAGQDVCEYPLARNTAMIAAIVVTEGLFKFLGDGEKRNYAVTLKDLKISEMDR